MLSDLNPQQREAVLHEEGPLLVVAGAGSGKTRVITRRIARLIQRGHPPASILAITFTNKAAGEMRRRVEEMVGEGRVLLSTFHAMCARFLRTTGGCIGVDPRFTICDSDDQKALIKEILKDLNLDPAHYPPASILSSISLLKNRLIGPEQAVGDARSFFERAAANVYSAYTQRLKVNDSLDFDDLLVKTLDMLRTDESVLEAYRRRYRFILIDEYQDTNRVQYLLVRTLAGAGGNICATGDPDQSIYRWRGADIRNIIDFETDFPGARVIKLEQNYRSTANIIKAASSVIRNNVLRKDRDLWTDGPPGDRITFLRAANEFEEADRIVQAVRDLHEGGTPYETMAIFYRINALSRSLERSLRLFNVPYVIVGGVEFYQRKEVKDLLAYLRLIHNPRDSISLFRVLNAPPRGIGLTTLQRLKHDVLAAGLAPVEVLGGYGPDSGLSARSLKGVRDFLALLQRWGRATESSIQELLEQVIGDVAYLDYLKRFNDGSAAERLDNVSELIAAVAEFERFNPGAGLGGFLEETALVQDIDGWEDGSHAVTLMTLHSAKGLEFDAVFIAGVEEGLIPHAFSQDTNEELEEERRLMYVGITRARKKLFLSHALYRSRFGERVRSIPSRFLDEIPSDVSDRPALEFGGRIAFAPIEAEREATLELDGDLAPSFECGESVEHPYFGRGEVVHVSGSGPSARLRVHFIHAGEKLLILEHARLKKIL